MNLNNPPDLSKVSLPKKAFRPTAPEDPALTEEIRRENKLCDPACPPSLVEELTRACQAGQTLDGLSGTKPSSLPLPLGSIYASLLDVKIFCHYHVAPTIPGVWGQTHGG